jgi:hypothetical protein
MRLAKFFVANAAENWSMKRPLLRKSATSAEMYMKAARFFAGYAVNDS